MAEKAVATDRGEIVLFYLICDVTTNALWQPYWIPLFSRSADGGRTWTEPKPAGRKRSRFFGVVYQDSEIRVLHFANAAAVPNLRSGHSYLVVQYSTQSGVDSRPMSGSCGGGGTANLLFHTAFGFFQSPNMGATEVHIVMFSSAFFPRTVAGTVHSKGAHAHSPKASPSSATAV